MSKRAVFVLLDIPTVLSFFFNIKLANLFFFLRKPVDSPNSQPLSMTLLKIFTPFLFIPFPAVLMPCCPVILTQAQFFPG